jgi:hypothetical protein
MHSRCRRWLFVALLGLKCFFKKIKKIKVRWDPHISVVNDGYATAPPGLKWFKENKIFLKNL